MKRKKIDKYLDLARELKKLWNIVTVISIVVGALGTVFRNLLYRYTPNRQLKRYKAQIEVYNATVF